MGRLKKVYVVLPPGHPIKKQLGNDGVSMGSDPFAYKPAYRIQEQRREDTHFCASVKEAVRHAVQGWAKVKSASQVSIMTSVEMDQPLIEQRRAILTKKLMAVMNEVLPDAIETQPSLWEHVNKMINGDTLVIGSVIPDDVVQALIDLEIDDGISKKAGVTGSSFMVEGMQRMLKSLEDEACSFGGDPAQESAAKRLLERARQAIAQEENKSSLAASVSDGDGKEEK